jgi:alanyl-tRNA synthetase
MSLQYLIDANIFITASRTYYDFDFGDSFWDFLVEQGEKKIIASIDKVLNELKKGDDKLKEWATKDFSKYFINTITDNVLKQYAILMQWADKQRNQYSQNAIDEFMKENNADAWLISLALTDKVKYVIVTFEKENNQIKRKIPIPNVCKEFNIKYCDLFQMLKKLNFKL